MANFFKGMLRANAANYGDLEGGMTKLKSGRLTISIEKGKCIAWIVGQDDIELSKSNVKNIEFVEHASRVTNLASNGGHEADIVIYKITMADGTVGTLRLKANTEKQVLNLLQ